MDLLANDLEAAKSSASILIDGGIINPALIAQAISPRQIVCLAAPKRSSADIWGGNDERNAMKKAIYQLPNPDEKWRRFLEFDERITDTILKECQENNIVVCPRSELEAINDFAESVASVLAIRPSNK